MQLQERENEIKGLLKERENDRAEANIMLEQFQQVEFSMPFFGDGSRVKGGKRAGVYKGQREFQRYRTR